MVSTPVKFWHRTSILRESTKTRNTHPTSQFRYWSPSLPSPKYYNIKILEYTKLPNRNPPCCDTVAKQQWTPSSTSLQLFIFCLQHVYQHMQLKFISSCKIIDFRSLCIYQSTHQVECRKYIIRKCSVPKNCPLLLLTGSVVCVCPHSKTVCHKQDR